MSDARLGFSKSIFTPLGRHRELLNISFMNDIYILYDDKDKIATTPPDTELRVVGKPFWTACRSPWPVRCFRRRHSRPKMALDIHNADPLWNYMIK
jgi:hypothetical protein